MKKLPVCPPALKPVLTLALILGLAPALSGCVVLSLALSTAGFVASGPLEYAGTALTIGEYAYEFAANDKTPDEVFKDKMADFLPDGEEEPTVFATNTDNLRLARDGQTVSGESGPVASSGEISLANVADRDGMDGVLTGSLRQRSPASLPNLEAELASVARAQQALADQEPAHADDDAARLLARR